MAGFFPVFFRQYWSAGANPRDHLSARASPRRRRPGGGAAGAAARRHRRSRRTRSASCSPSACSASRRRGAIFRGQGPVGAGRGPVRAGTLGFTGGIVFYDALLLDVAAPAEYDRVSALGYGLGYLGGGVLFAINVLMVVKPALFGSLDAAAAVRLSFLSVAVWWACSCCRCCLRARSGAAGAVPRGRGPAPAGRNCVDTARARAPAPALLAVPARILAVHRGVEHHHQDGGGLRHVARARARRAAGRTCCSRSSSRFPPRWLRLARQPHRRRRGILLGPGRVPGVTVWATSSSRARVLPDGRRARPGAGRRAEPVALLFGRLVPAGEIGGVLRLLRHGRQVRHGDRSRADGRVALLTGSTRASILALLVLFVGAVCCCGACDSTQPGGAAI